MQLLQKYTFKISVLGAAAIVASFSSAAYAVTDIDTGVGGTASTAGTADTLYITNTNGNMLSIDGYDINLQNSEGWGFQTNSSDTTVTAEDDIILNADTPNGGAGGIIMQKAGLDLMEVNENGDGGTQIYTTTTMYDALDMDGNQIHGLAPGTLGTDAVNLNQLNGIENDMSKGIAATTAIANIPQVDQGKTYSLGLGFGHYNGENAFAAGGSWRYNNDGILKASVGSGGSGTVFGVGTAMSW